MGPRRKGVAHAIIQLKGGSQYVARPCVAMRCVIFLIYEHSAMLAAHRNASKRLNRKDFYSSVNVALLTHQVANEVAGRCNVTS